jgi:hypothetical protein
MARMVIALLGMLACADPDAGGETDGTTRGTVEPPTVPTLTTDPGPTSEGGTTPTAEREPPVDQDATSTEVIPEPDTSVDADGDGFSIDDGDCDDADPFSFPGADEVWYDGLDQDCACDGDRDADGDGVDVGSDCDDEDPGIAPGEPEIAGDGVDQDCVPDLAD